MSKKFKKTIKTLNFIEIYGFHAVKAALKNTKRNHQNIIISENLKEKFKKIELKVNKVNYIPNDKINKTYGNEKSHQGIILKTSKLKQPSIEDVLYNSKNKKSELMIMLDHVSDPQNIGSIMRSCALFNCSSIIISKNNAPDVTSSMAKAASGALEIVNYIRVTNLSRTIDRFKKNNYWVIGFDNNENHQKNNFQLPKKCLLIFGAEHKGLRELTKKECDQIFTIQTQLNKQYKLESLNIANACTIALYEHFKTYNK